APSAPLASSGNFVRVFFGHDAPDDPAASLAVAINGKALANVQLSPGTRAGGVFEKEVPTAMLRSDRPNRLDARFSLLQPARAPAVRVTPQVVAGDPLRWLASASAPALVMGRLDRLPAAVALLQGAGFSRTPEGWRAPQASAAIPADSGIVAVTESSDARGKPV